MIVTLLQIAAVAPIATFFIWWRKAARRRNAQTWDALLARLRPDWSAHALSDHFLWEEGLNANPNEAWERMEGPKGLWIMYQNAIVMQEMADFAARNYEGVDPVLVQTLHSDALQIRVCVVAALAQYAFTQASAGVRVHAYRAAGMYTGMAARMTCFLQDYAAVRVPDFVAAM